MEITEIDNMMRDANARTKARRVAPVCAGPALLDNAGTRRYPTVADDVVDCNAELWVMQRTVMRVT